MTNFAYILPMLQKPDKNRRRCVLIVYDGFELIDLSGPAAVFSAANALSKARLYDIVIVSPQGGSITSSCGIAVDSIGSDRLRLRSGDTVLVMGAESMPLRAAMAEPAIIRVLRAASKKSERYGSVCGGTFLLGACGLLGGKRVATHWRGCERLAAFVVDAHVEPDALYAVDGRLWTSAGATTGIDMALAMVEHDHSAALMGAVAKQLVVYAHRPGHQSQFSSLLDAQTAADGAFSKLIAWMARNVDRPIKVADMASRARMSERSFHRKFVEATGLGPAKYLEGLRLDGAKRYLEAGEPAKAVAQRAGFRSESAFRAAFAARFGITPAHHRRMHRTDRLLGTIDRQSQPKRKRPA
jgi:transcriptional regulator GlxA family with amidase domain